MICSMIEVNSNHMRKYKYPIMCICILLSMHHVYAQRQDSLSLKQCMQYAVDHSTQIQNQLTTQDDAQLQRRDAILQTFTPHISAGSSAYYNFGRAVDPESNAYTDVTSFNNNYAITGSLTLFSGLSSINRIRMANTIVKMGMSEAQKLRNDLCLAIMEAYFKVQFQSQMSQVILAQVETAKENLKLVSLQYEQGQKGYADKVQTEADLAEKEYQQVQNENRLNDALLTLKDLMLWPVEEQLLLKAAPASSDDIHCLFITEAVSLLSSCDEIIAYAKENHPTAQLAKGEMRKAQMDLRAARGNFFPTLSLGGGWSTNYYTYPGKEDYHAQSFHSQLSNNRGSYVQLSLSFPIFNHLGNFSTLSRKKNTYRRAQASFKQTQHDIEAEVSRAVHDCRGAFRASLHAGKHASVQKESYRLGQRKMVQGLMSPVEFHTLSNNFLQAKAEQLNAQFTYLLKQSIVNYYKGINYLDQLK